MPHKEEYTEFTPDQYPAFPDSPNFPTIDLQTISLSKLQQNDANEQDRVLKACKDWGFFYLDLSNSQDGSTISSGADDLCRVAEKVFQLPLEEKMKYGPQGKSLSGYKHVGRTVTDKNKTPDTAEFFNVAKNDSIVPDAQMARDYPQVVLDNKPLFNRYSRAAHSIGLHILDLLAQKLGIDPEEIHSRHKLEDLAGDHIRMTRGPARETTEMPEIQTPSHTDFGTITILMNWLGGLQVYGSPNHLLGNLSYDDGDANEGADWLWVKPKPGCAIVNLGDAAVKFTNGVLCSGRHRVVPAPGEQGKWPRYSIVYFVRPVNESKLKTLKGHSIPAAGDEDEEGVGAQEWIFQQSEKLRTGNYK
ncbi:related to oxidoreductase, 2OG-Fe(II) oxygenase family [Lecanosticta acicola]|uniref:Related to oxidoreductase, 2OG-Fe(II) oxygenase family n=1 Tax=Lecanosticta acicola TaxID=111012 RepID=A0AAI9EAT5_9PEZI|nr:related to oxidoreductase, 2OG-Fe(II) oxygenase family [Lecanosticta acicola]